MIFDAYCYSAQKLITFGHSVLHTASQSPKNIGGRTNTFLLYMYLFTPNMPGNTRNK